MNDGEEIDKLDDLFRNLLKDGTSNGLSKLAIDAIKRQDNLFHSILAHGVAGEGYDDHTIEQVLLKLSFMDSNNNSTGCGVGEREGRIYNDLVRKRHWNFAHGIGRSGNVSEIQPKAAGSAILQKVTTKMALQMLKVAGLKIPTKEWKACVLPMATGMALSFAIKAVGMLRTGSKYVLMPRIDQKSCLKCVEMAGYQLVIIPNKIDGDAIVTNVDAIKEAINRLGAINIAAVISTTSCFAPRICDRIVEIGRMLEEFNIPQIINNAYGLQSGQAINQINEAIQQNLHIACIVHSTDKNFMLPVGGSIIAGLLKNIELIEEMYPGRASMAPLLDLFITILSMGRNGYKKLLLDRKDSFNYLLSKLYSLETVIPIKVLSTLKNDISIAVAINSDWTCNFKSSKATPLGPFLFVRGVSGAKVLSPLGEKTVSKLKIINFGMHIDTYPQEYFTVASAIGQKKEEIDKFISKLLKYFKKEKSNALMPPFVT